MFMLFGIKRRRRRRRWRQECIRRYNMGHTHVHSTLALPLSISLVLSLLRMKNERWRTRARDRTPNVEHKPNETRLGFFTQKRLTQFECRHDRRYLQAVTVLRRRTHCTRTDFNRIGSKNREPRIESREPTESEDGDEGEENEPRIAYVVATYFIQSTCARPAE